MNNTSFLGLYVVLSLLATLASVILALLKVFKVITIPWLFVTLPVCFLIAFVTATSLIMFCIFDICSKRNKRYITKNIYD
jgi:hypothetical protein